jgi:hypothetical protein
MRRYQRRLGEWLIFVGICAAIFAFVVFIPQGARVYLSGFAYSCAAISAAMVPTWRFPEWYMPCTLLGFDGLE